MSKLMWIAGILLIAAGVALGAMLFVSTSSVIAWLSFESVVLLLVGGRTDTAARERLYEDVGRRLPELLNGLRLRAVEAGLAVSDDETRQAVSPFGEPAKGGSAAHDPDPFDPFREGN